MTGYIVFPAMSMVIVVACLFSVGIFLAVSSADEGTQSKAIACWHNTYDHGRTNCTVLSWKQQQVWSENYKYTYMLQLEVEFLANGSMLTLMAPNQADVLPEWLGIGNQVECYFPLKEMPNNVNCGRNIWIGAPPTDTSKDENTKSVGIGMACFLFALSVCMIIVMGLMIRREAKTKQVEVTKYISDIID